jgi:putative transposase
MIDANCGSIVSRPLRRNRNHRLSQGKKVVHVIRALGVTDVTYYRWRQEFGGMSVSKAKRLKELEKENERLRKAVSDLTLDKLTLKGAAAKGNF